MAVNCFFGIYKYENVDVLNFCQVEFNSVPYYSRDSSQYEDSGSTHTYDLLGRLISSVDQDGRTSSATYSGLKTTFTNAKNQTKEETKNSLGQKTKVLDHNGQSIAYEYDALGKLVWMKDSTGNEWKMGYNERGFKTQMLDPDKGYLSYTYDAAGRIRTQTDNKGQVQESHYDNLGRLEKRIDDATGSRISSDWSYFSTGLHKGKLKRTSGNGFLETYTYDSQSRIYRTRTKIDGTIYLSSRTYDSFGRPYQLTYPGSDLMVSNEYDPTTGILKKVSNAANATVYWEAITQNARGSVEAFTLGGKVAVSNTLNGETGQIDSIFVNHVDSGSTLMDLAFTYDAIGNLETRKDTINDVFDEYEYDDLNRLKHNYVYRNFTRAPLEQQSLTYDSLGNIQTKSDVEGGALYEYGASGCGNINQTCPHAVSKIGTQTFRYDANGNMTSGYGRSMQYTSFNKPSYMSKNGNSASITYGPNHSRFKRVDSNGASSSTTYYAQGLMEKVVGDTSTKTKLFIGGFAVVTQQENQADKTNYMLKDQLGSVVAITDETGTVVERFNYDAWGKRRHLDGNAMNDSDFFSYSSLGITTRSYTGHESLDGVGLIHMNGRVYDPVVARFLSADSIIQAPTNLQSLNRYSYVFNNPLKFTDPSGYLSLSDLDPTNGLKKLNEHRKSFDRQVLRTYRQLVSASPTLHYGSKALKRSKKLRQLGQVAAGVADIFGCSGMCSAGYAAHLAAISGGSPSGVALAGISGYATGRMAIGGSGAISNGFLATVNWSAGAYINSTVDQAVGKYLVRHTNITGRDIAFIQAGLAIGGALSNDGTLGGAFDLAGKVWNAPNTAIGLLYGGAGYLAGMALGTDPSISINNNAIQFQGLPAFMMPSAMTLGNVIVYGVNSSPGDPNIPFVNTPNGHTVGQEEFRHTQQGQILGPLYFPFHGAGGVSSLMRQSHSGLARPTDLWHRNNFMETGPMQNRIF